MMLSIEFTSTNIYIVEQNATKRGLRVENVIRIPMPENSYQKGLILNTSVVAGVIAEQLKERGVRTKKAVVCVDTSDIIQREMSIPSGNEKQSYGMIQTEMNRLDLLKNEYVFDYLYRERQADGMHKVSVYLLPKVLIQNYNQTLKRAGLQLVKVKPLDDCMGKLVALLELGKQQDMSILISAEKGIIQFCLTGGNLENIYRNVQIENEDAVEENIFIVSANYQLQNSMNPIERVFDQVVEMVSKLIQFQSQRDREHSVKQILVYGEVAQNQEFAERIGTATGISTFKCELPPNKVKFVSGKEELWSYHPIGMECSALLGETKELSFMKDFLMQSGKYLTVREQLPMIIGAVVMLILVIFGVSAYFYNLKVENQVAQTEKTLQEILMSEEYIDNQAKMQLVKSLEIYNGICEQYITILEETSRFEIEEFLKINQIKPADIEIAGYRYENNQIILRCYGMQQDAPASFAKIIADQELFQDVSYAGFQAENNIDGITAYQFEITCSLK